LGYCPAHSGSGMAGIVLIDDMTGSVIYREYLAVKLTNPLLSNMKYYVTYYLRLGDSVRYSSNRISIYFGDSISKNNPDTINVTPQISSPTGSFITNKSNWTKLRGSFMANGGEKFLYLGNFKHPFINDTLFVNGSNNTFDYNLIYYFVDDICVSTDSTYSEQWITSISENQISELHFFPNPVNNILHVSGIKDGELLKIYSLVGDRTDLKVVENNVDVSFLKEGIYFVEYRNSENKVLNYKLIKSKK
jgi:hypothetical protein